MVAFPPTRSFFVYLAVDGLYNMFKDIYSSKKTEGSNIINTEKEIFSKFSNVTNVNQFEEVFEREFNDQRQKILADYGPNSENPQYETREELYSTLWERLNKFLEEKGEKRTRVGDLEKNVKNFTKNPDKKEFQEAFFNSIRDRIENSPNTKKKTFSNLRDELKKIKTYNVLGQIMRTKFIKTENPPKYEDFKQKEYEYFNFAVINILINNMIKGSKARLKKNGWEVEEKVDNEWIKIFKVFNVRELDNRFVNKAKNEVKNLVLDTKQVRRKTDKNIVVEQPRPVWEVEQDGKKIPIEIQVGIDFSPLWELLIKGDMQYKTEKFDVIVEEMETVVQIVEQSDEEKIEKYLEVLKLREGPPVEPYIIFNLKEAKSIGTFYKKDGKYVDIHPMLEDILLKDASIAMREARANSILSLDAWVESRRLDKEYGLSRQEVKAMKRKEVQPKQEDEEQKNQTAVASQKYNKILDERQKILRDAISYEEKTLVKLFNEVKRGRVEEENLQVYGNYLKDKKEEDDETLIDLESDLFSALIADIDKKLVYNPKSDIFTTSNKTLQKEINEDLTEILISSELDDNNMLQVEDGVIKMTPNVLGEVETDLEDYEVQTTKLGKPEFDGLFLIVQDIAKKNQKTMSEGLTEQEKTKGIDIEDKLEYILDRAEHKYTGKLDLMDAFEYAFDMSQTFIVKSEAYDTAIEKIENSVKEDLSMENQELIDNIKSLASQVVENLKQLKDKFAKGLNEKLEAIVNKEGRNKKLFNTTDGKKMLELLIDNGLLERGES
jgi:hypothetical protein